MVSAVGEIAEKAGIARDTFGERVDLIECPVLARLCITGKRPAPRPMTPTRRTEPGAEGREETAERPLWL